MPEPSQTSSEPSAYATEDSWSIEDLIDFEYAARLEARQDEAEIQQRDKGVRERLKARPTSLKRNRVLLKHWLQKIREDSFPKNTKAGSFFTSSFSFVSKACAFVSVGLGAVLAASLLRYDGIQAVNVSAYIGLFIILQLALALLSTLLVLLPSKSGNRLNRFLGISSLLTIALRLFSYLSKAIESKLKGKHRNALEELEGSLESLARQHARLMRWLAFSAIQRWALAFNCGVLVATLAIIAFSDRAFGWQTTLDLAPEFVYQAIRASSFPWSWAFGEGTGFPSLADIEGSRIVLKDGMRALRSDALVSWWSYLCLGVISYGLIPRLAFAIFGQRQSRLVLRSHSFDDATASAIANRIRGLNIGFESDCEAKREISHDANSQGEIESPRSVKGRTLCLAVGDFKVDSIQSRIASNLHVPLENVEMHRFDSLSDLHRSDSIEQMLDDFRNIVLLHPAWLPPIEETKETISLLRSHSNADTLITLLLAGMPAADEYEIPTPESLNAWRSFVRKQGDPYLAMQELAP